MTTVIMNDVSMEGKVGERLLNVARRNGAHIGFVCDNAGTCQTCRCRVLAGEEHLSPPNEAEQAWIPAERLAQGERLACQTLIQSQGEIRVLSRAEELRRLVMGVITPRAGASRLAPLKPLATSLAQMTTEQVVRFPGNIISSITRLGPVRFAFPVVDRGRIFSDAARVAKQLRAGTERKPQLQRRSIPVIQAFVDQKIKLADE